MTAWNPRANAIFLDALDLQAGQERQAYLDKACGIDRDLRHQVEVLLAAHTGAGSFLDHPAYDAAPQGTVTPRDDATPPESTPRKSEEIGAVLAGKYKLLQALGEGGMGSVFTAQQTEPVKRLVAVKVIKPGMDSKQVLVRFEAERQALALMDHPHIAHVLDAGTTESGRPFFVMELVKGVPITKYCDEQRLSVRQRLELFVPLCQAIQHAHQKGIIHRDIKPSNVLVTLSDDRAVPKVIDFGIAKATVGQLTEGTLSTGVGAVLGTPQYMSPEQASANLQDVDTRSDVYSLGVLLYELLTGTTPLDCKRGSSVLEILQALREEEPPRPSERLRTSPALPGIAAARRTEPTQLTRLARGELDWIVMKALDKDRRRRYETASDLARDVERYLADEVVEARPPSSAYRLRKFLRRNRGAVLAVGLVLLTLLAGVVGTTWALLEAREQRDVADRAHRAEEAARRQEAARADSEAAARREARAQADLARAVQTFLQKDLLQQADPLAQEDQLLALSGPGLRAKENPTVKELLDRAARELTPDRIEAKFPAQPLVQAEILRTIGRAYRGTGEYSSAIAHLERAHALYHARLGADNSDTLDTLQYLAGAYGDAGRTADSLKLLEQLRAALVARHGLEHPKTLTSLNNLAGAYLFAGRATDAIRLLEQARAAKAPALAPELPAGVILRANLAAAYRLAGRTADAIKLSEQIRVTSVEKFGADSPVTLLLLANLAAAYRLAGRTADAIALGEQLREGHRTTFGPDHRHTLILLSNLAGAYREAGRVTEAIRLLEQVRDRGAAKLGLDHPDLLDIRHNLATAYYTAGRKADALRLYEQLLTKIREVFGPLHPRTLALLNNFIVVVQEAKDIARLAELRKELLVATRQQVPADDPRLATELATLGICLARSGKPVEAVPLLRESLAIREKKRLDPLTTSILQAFLGEILLGQKKYAEAEPLLRAGYEGLKAPAEKVPQVQDRLRQTAERLVQLYEAIGDKEKADEWRKTLAAQQANKPKP